MEPVIKFRGYSIEKLVFTKEEMDFDEEFEDQEDKDLSLSLNYGVTEDFKEGKVELTVRIKNTENDIKISLKVVGDFEINNLDDIEKIHQFLSINGTAILYPYVRSIISMVSSLDSPDAILLPTINTSNFGQH
ncbi:protein-export chaperone SecB [Planococcus sp. ISL-110]|uniref:protein-export chaperone SecB n=1 Tax=Planococcus sp. ISL-110 TaxID=2819167 RepID=UPI001BE7400C|nr:protein-export chaperone SecB [Planococcus sp. ISL-110]MBT2569835.1 protein-export chaperone SecB [Planococcus sp. ISL-110]